MAREQGMVTKKSRFYPWRIALFLALVLFSFTLPSRALAATVHLISYP